MREQITVITVHQSDTALYASTTNTYGGVVVSVLTVTVQRQSVATRGARRLERTSSEIGLCCGHRYGRRERTTLHEIERGGIDECECIEHDDNECSSEFHFESPSDWIVDGRAKA